MRPVRRSRESRTVKFRRNRISRRAARKAAEKRAKEVEGVKKRYRKSKLNGQHKP